MTVQTQANNTSIRPILYANAIFSTLSGLEFALASKFTTNLIGVDNSPVIFDLGLALIGFGLFLFYKASRPVITREFVLFIIIADSLWVLSSILFLLTSWVPFTLEGKWVVGIKAIIVDIFAGLQFFKWRKMQ